MLALDGQDEGESKDLSMSQTKELEVVVPAYGMAQPAAVVPDGEIVGRMVD